MILLVHNVNLLFLQNIQLNFLFMALVIKLLTC